MNRHLYAAITFGLISAAIPLRAANGPHAGMDRQSKVVWTDDKLHSVGPISIVGQVDEKTSNAATAPGVPEITQDPTWYAQQAARLRDELEQRQNQLRDYQQALADARSLRESTGGINLVGDDYATTPDTGIETLQQRVGEVQTRLAELEDLARRNDIEPGTLRGQ
jgi:hypothetical protein